MNDFATIRPATAPVGKHKPPEMHDVAQNLERAFLAEMLSFMGVKEMSGEFGGGAGEEQFQTFLRDAHAKLIVEKGGLGLSGHFLKNLEGR